MSRSAVVPATLGFSIILVACMAASCSSRSGKPKGAEGVPGRAVTVFVTTEMKGQLEPCGCHEGMCTWTLKEGAVEAPAPGEAPPPVKLPTKLPRNAPPVPPPAEVPG